MSFSLAQKLDKKTKNIHRFIMAFGVTDEIFALGASCKGKLRPSYHYGIMAIAIPGWVAGTFVGGVFGNILPAFIMSALGIAIYGMFLAIILPFQQQLWLNFPQHLLTDLQLYADFLPICPIVPDFY